MQIGVSNPNVPIFPPRVCTLVLFIFLPAIECKLQDVHKSLLNSREIQHVHLTILCAAEVIPQLIIICAAY